MGRWLENIRLQVDRNTIGVTLDDELRVFAETGKELLRRKAGRNAELSLGGESRGVLHLPETHHGAESDSGSRRPDTLHAVRADTGKTLWTLSHDPCPQPSP